MDWRSTILAVVWLVAVALSPARADEGPADPDLRARYSALRAEIDALNAPAGADTVVALDAKIVELGSSLIGPDTTWAARLDEAWGSRLSRVVKNPIAGEKALTRAEAAYRALGDDARLAATLKERAVARTYAKRDVDALVDLGAAEELFAKLGDEAGAAYVHERRGIALLNLSRYDESIASLTKAQEAWARLGDRAAIGRVTAIQATTSLLVGRHREALEQCDRADEIFKKLDNDLNRARVHHNRAAALVSLGRNEEALEEYAFSEPIFQRRGERRLIADTAFARCAPLRELERFDEAMQQADAAEAIYRELRSDEDIGATLCARAAILTMAKRTDEALRELDRAASLCRLDANLAHIDHDRSTLLCQRDRFLDALAACDRAEPVFDRLRDAKNRVSVLTNRGRALRGLGRYEESLATYERAASLLEESLRDIQRVGEPSAVAYRQPLYSPFAYAIVDVVLMKDVEPRHVASAYHVMQVFQGLGMAQLMSERGRGASSEGPADFQRERHAIAEKMRIAEAALGDALREKTPASLAAAKEQETALAARKAEVASLQKERRDVAERVRVRDRAFADAIYPAPSTLPEVQAALPERTALVECVTVTDAGAFAFVITRDSATIARLGDPEGIGALVTDVVRDLATSPKPDLARLAALSQRVLAPILGALPKNAAIATLLVSPGGDLCRVPFEALLTRDVEKESAPATWPFLVKSYAVAYTHSGTVLRALLARADSRSGGEAPSFVGFGNPLIREEPLREGVAKTDADRRMLEPIVASAEEVIRAARHFGDGDAEAKRLDAAEKSLAGDALGTGAEPTTGKRFAVFLGRAASEGALKKRPEVKRASVLHLACHGEADLTSPELSHLVLARSEGSGEDGLLTLRELGDLGLASELVVLSACETNAGTLVPFEGIAGLSRAALVAGACSVLSTLWRVPDRGARDFIVAFYGHWLRDGMKKGEALAAAKRAAIDAGVPVHVWAAYTLWGLPR